MTAMDHMHLTRLLETHTAFIKRIDTHIRHIEKTYPDHLACGKGCDECCRYLTLLPVEACCLSAAFLKSTPRLQRQIIQNIKAGPKNCPLLINHACALYSVRPVICRTHGFPIFISRDSKNRVDFCPKNFKGITSFPNDALLDLERLNQTLIAVNRQFLNTLGKETLLPDRLPMADALFLLSDSA